MLVVSRRIEETLIIGEQIEIKVLDVFATDSSGSRASKVASIGITAPRDIEILRGELYRTRKENQAAATGGRVASPGQLAGLLKEKLAKK